MRRRLVLALWCCCFALTLPAAAQVQELTRALVAPGDGAAFPEGAAAEEVTLPDDWSLSRPGHAGGLWYRLRFAATGTDGEPLALYVARACSDLHVRLNGELVHGSGRIDEPVPDRCDRPQLVTLPAALLRAGGNTLDLLVVGHPLAEVASLRRAGGLSAPMVGPLQTLAARHARATMLQLTVPQALGATLVLMGGFMFVLGFVNRRESHLAYFGALSVGWALLDLRLWWPALPLGHAEVELLACALLGFVAWAAVQFLLRHAGERSRVADLLLPAQCALLPLSLLAAGPQRLHALASAWTALLALEVAAAAAWHLLHERRRRPIWPMATLLAALAAAALAALTVRGPGAWPLPAQLAQLLVPLILVLAGLRLVHQQGHALQTAEQGRQQLEHRVREATAEIERNYRQLAELRVEQVTERERKRIAADLHDDLGAKLLTIVHTSDNDRISTLAREALEEMRLSVRGLTGKPVRLADALGDWRAEVVARLGQAGIEGEWDAPEDLPQTLSARAYVQTTRILREATSNIIKHSRATVCTVRATIAEGDFLVVVKDNGQGISNEIDQRLDRGHGLASMKNRAKQLQGQCLVESGPGYGTVIRLTVPLERAIEGS